MSFDIVFINQNQVREGFFEGLGRFGVRGEFLRQFPPYSLKGLLAKIWSTGIRLSGLGIVSFVWLLPLRRRLDALFCLPFWGRWATCAGKVLKMG